MTFRAAIAATNCVVGFSLKKDCVGFGVVVFYCKKKGLMLLLGCVIKSKCGCGQSSQIDCVMIVVIQFSF